MELHENMRQEGDREFTQILDRVRTISCSKQDFNTFETSFTSEDKVHYHSDALHVYHLNKDVHEQNMTVLNKLAPKNEQVVLTAMTDYK